MLKEGRGACCCVGLIRLFEDMDKDARRERNWGKGKMREFFVWEMN